MLTIIKISVLKISLFILHFVFYGCFFLPYFCHIFPRPKLKEVRRFDVRNIRQKDSVWWGIRQSWSMWTGYFPTPYIFPRCTVGEEREGKESWGGRGQGYNFHMAPTLPGSLAGWRELCSGLNCLDEEGRKLSGNVHSSLFLGNHWTWDLAHNPITAGLWIKKGSARVMGAGILVLICTRLREKEGNEPGIDVLLLNMFAISGTVMILSPNYYYYFLIVKDYQGFFFFPHNQWILYSMLLKYPPQPMPSPKGITRHSLYC